MEKKVVNFINVILKVMKRNGLEKIDKEQVPLIIRSRHHT